MGLKRLVPILKSYQSFSGTAQGPVNVIQDGGREGKKIGSPPSPLLHIMPFTAAAVNPPAGLNQILIPVVVFETQSEL